MTAAISRPYPAPIPENLAPADEFVEYACLTFQPDDSPARRRRAERLATRLNLAEESFSAAVILADVAAVGRALAADPGLASRPGGPRGWVPLLYTCFGRVLRPGGDAVAVARLLLANGADPASYVMVHDQYRWTGITAAIGLGESGPIAAPPHRQARALVELLLDAGADPNDSQALYNTHFRPDNSWLELFLARGLGAKDHANWTRDDPTRILDYLLGQAVRQGLLDRVALLLAQGASPNGINRYNQRAHLENAQLDGHTRIAALLERHGAAPARLSPAEQFRADCLSGDEAAVRAKFPEALADRDDVGTLLAAAEFGRLRVVRLLLDLGVPVGATNGEGLTALHQAAMNGHRLVVDELLARGAPLEIRDLVYGGTPLGRVTWFSRAWPTPERDEVRHALAARSQNTFDVCYAGDAERLTALLEEDPARANAKHPLDGRSPLHVLAGRDVPACGPLIQLLLARGADLNARNNEGKTALDLALETEDEEAAALLAGRGAARG